MKKIAVINDFCGFGRCSIAVSLPVISAMKVQCCPLPTSIFSNHTGYESFFSTDYTAHMNAYMDEWAKLSLQFDGILTGYLGSAEQVNIVKRFFELFKKPQTLTVVDPVMGDGGKLYPSYSPVLARELKGLLPYADVLTPNLTEACFLTETDYKPDMTPEELTNICQKLSAEGPKQIVISGIERNDYLENFVFERGKEPQIISVPKEGPCRAGTGDVFSSIIAADMVNGKELTAAVEHATAFISKALRHTARLNLPLPDGICFEEYLSEI